MRNMMYQQQPMGPLVQGGIGIAQGGYGRVSAPSSFVAPNQSAYGNMYGAAMENLGFGRRQMPQAEQQLGSMNGMPANAAIAPFQYGGLMPYAQNQWQTQFSDLRPYQLNRLANRGIDNPQAYADFMQQRVMNGKSWRGF